MKFRAGTVGLALMALFSTIRPAAAGMDDFKLDSVEIVDLKDRPDIDWLFAKPFSIPMMMATFSGDVDLREYARPHGFNIHYRVGLCLEGSFSIDTTRQLQAMPDVYDSLGNINSRREITSSQQGASGYLYHVYFEYAFEKAGSIDYPERVPSFLYDLRKTPADVCVQIRGGNMLAQSFQANTVLIPASNITEAIMRAEGLKRRAKARPN